MSPIEISILAAIQTHRQLNLKDLRSHINVRYGLEDQPREKQIPLDTIKTLAMRLGEAGMLQVKQIGNSYQFRLKGSA